MSLEVNMSAPWPVKKGAFKSMDFNEDPLPILISKINTPPKLKIQLAPNNVNNLDINIQTTNYHTN